jgi:hypothetical protein
MLFSICTLSALVTANCRSIAGSGVIYAKREIDDDWWLMIDGWWLMVNDKDNVDNVDDVNDVDDDGGW